MTTSLAAGLAISSLAPHIASAASIPGPISTPFAPMILPAPVKPKPQMGFEDRVEEFTLPNGLHFIVLPRTTAPIVSANIYVNAGAFQEVDGQTGLAHLLEHMAFKGTRRIGAKNWQQEAPLLDALDEVFYELQYLKSTQAPANRIAQLSDKLNQLQSQADALVIPNAYGAMLSQAGGVGLNATTSHDATRYFVSLPANKLELWFALESERFRAPVFRELYSEKRVIEEERRLRVDGAPLGRFQQEFAARALANNYRRPVIGVEQDFDGLGRREVVDFFAQHYGPQQVTIAIVGDTTTEQVRRLAEKYWGDWQGAARVPQASTAMRPTTPGSPSTSMTGGWVGAAAAAAGAGQPWRWYDDHLSAELAQLNASLGLTKWEAGSDAWHAASSNDQAAASSACQDGVTNTGSPCYSNTSIGGPLVMLGFKRPSLAGRDGPLYEVMTDLLTGSRTARLTGRLVLQQQVLRGVRAIASYPGDKYEGLCLIAAVPQQGGRPEDAQQLVVEELERFAQEGPTAAELARVQKATRLTVLAGTLSNSSMASLLATYQGLTGSWRKLVADLDYITQLKPGLVRDTAQQLLAPGNMFSGYVYQPNGR